VRCLLAGSWHLTCMHNGDRSAKAIDAGGVLPGYAGVIARDGDGDGGYGHLTSALHAWCGVHLHAISELRDSACALGPIREPLIRCRGDCLQELESGVRTAHRPGGAQR
jgi:hypothetical protein